MTDENPDLYEFVAGRKKYADGRADYHLWKFDAAAGAWIIAATYFFAGAPWINGKPIFDEAPDYAYMLVGGVTLVPALYLLLRLLAVRRRHNARAASKVYRDLTGEDPE